MAAKTQAKALDSEGDSPDHRLDPGEGPSLYSLKRSSSMRMRWSVCLNDREQEIPRVAEEIIRAFSPAPGGTIPVDDDAAVSERALFCDGVGFVIPARCLKLGHDKPPARIRFIQSEIHRLIF